MIVRCHRLPAQQRPVVAVGVAAAVAVDAAAVAAAVERVAE